MKALARDGHPFQSFSTGNLDTLQKLPESLGINTRDLVIDFYKEHYSANIMKLVVYGKESLDTLQVPDIYYHKVDVAKNLSFGIGTVAP
jgi:insulysin